jgi:putative transposase
MGWRRRAVLDRALRVLVACRRLAAGRKRRPTAAIVATRSVKAGPRRGPRGYDAHKKIKGRKRVRLVGTQGDPLGVRVVAAADGQDRDASRALAPELDAHASLLLVWWDRAFAGDDPAGFLGARSIAPALVGAPGRQGFQVEPRRWEVEPTFGCLQRYRRLRVDDGMSHDASRHTTVLAAVFMIGMRLQRTLRP